jgi:lipopolysaccharide/colanic/teichoic acid biosynthesis glycosyltransferase
MVAPGVPTRPPASRASLRVRLSPVDVTLAAVSPFIALYLRNVDLVSAGGMFVADSFALISLTASLIAFRIFRVSRVIALLDEEPRSFGRSVNGVHVFGPPAQLEAIIEEFATHGVRTDQVVVGGKAAGLSGEILAEVKDICARRNLDLLFMPDPFGLGLAERPGHSTHIKSDHLPTGGFLPDFPPSPYLRFKRLIDAIAAAILILWLLPLLTIAAIAVFLDVGSPVLFWQQRLGQCGRELQIYKLRTLRLPFDRKGQLVPEEQRISPIGRLLRMIRIDELPQLLNVLVGDMSLIGPRPLLAQDQPPNSAIRFAVRPGITGWAQVNGGAKLSATEKAALDAWYIRNTFPLLDLRIIGMTVLSLVRGDRRSEKALAQAQSFHVAEYGDIERGLEQASGLAVGVVGPLRVDDREPAFMQPR